MTLLQFTSTEIQELAGVTARQLQWWDERKVVRPGRDTWQRAYSGEQALLVIVAAELRRKGLSLQKVRRLLRAVREKIASMGRRNPLSVLAEARLCLVTDGRAIGFTEESELLSLLTQMRRGAYVLSLSEQARRVQRARSFSYQKAS